MQNILIDLTKLLEQDDRLVAEGKLLKNKIVELALALDPVLIKLLMKQEEIKKHFFIGVDGVLVFDKIKFQQFVSNKQFLPDSYTAFKNKIGLTVDGEYLTENKEVVLAWPYKDCVLEGGQDKEDAKRNEVFWNETLAPDQIDRLLAPKALTKFKKYDKDGEHKVTALSLNDNLIIKGNNLLALQTLKKVYTGKVKLGYFDPPYNTGNDGFGYNDQFNHSAWLTFLKNRLEITKSLLTKDGSIWISIDDKEAHYLKVLCDEVFGRENFIMDISWRKRDGAPNDRKVGAVHEHILVYAKTRLNSSKQTLAEEAFNLLPRTEKADAEYKVFNEPDGPDPRGRFRKIDTTANAKGGRYVASLSYPFKNPYTGEEVTPREGTCWRHNKEEMERLQADKRLFWGADGKATVPMKKMFIFEARQGMTIPSLWLDVALNQHAATEIEKLFGEKAVFETPKPEALLNQIIHIASNPGDLVLDIFSGSGTTAAVAHKMGRRYIGVEQMNYIENITVERVKKVIGKNVQKDGKMFEELECDQGGISKTVKWKGGGSFVYCELNQANQTFIAQIRSAKKSADLQGIWVAMQERAFLSYKVDPKTIDANKSEFEALSFEDQQRFLIEVLDKNMLYVPYSEIDDATYSVSDEDKALNRQFFNLK
jgi:adenine-specific DNA-methyltransferase